MKKDGFSSMEISKQFDPASQKITQRIRVYGIVQGVGFRPTVSRLAARANICGSVCNRGSYVEIIAQGSESQCHTFLELLKNHPPKRAAILGLDVCQLTDEDSRVPGYDDFSIIESEKTGGSIYISPDLAICDDCKRELFDKNDRRYLHPFINCTNCGPRMTILEALPYDRQRTSMRDFPMCSTCAEEYHSPGDRRYDAQPVCCNDCGPTLYVLDQAAGAPSDTLTGGSAITQARETILAGGIIAVKGIGGFHLCCDATNEAAVSLLRARKHRPMKPFAIMARDLDAAARICHIDEKKGALLNGHQKPIILLEKRTDCHTIAPSTAPDNPMLGLMLPYAPVQLLLFDYPDGHRMPDYLVMTSANESGAPICRDDGDALSELPGLADVILSNDRQIRTRADDTVTDFYQGEPYMIRRSRGFAPLPQRMSFLPDASDSVIGIGGELKNSFCIGRGSLFYPSPYIGDLGDIRTVTALRETVQCFLTMLEAKPGAICCDLHPLYQSRAVAFELAKELGEQSIPVFSIQHHYAHILSCMAENDFADKVIGISFDGTGYGTDQTIWGGELLLCDWDGFTRAAHITPFLQAGGDLSSKEGWRIAAQMITAIYGEKDASDLVESLCLCSKKELALIQLMAVKGINTVSSTSAGRLFDAVSAILGIRRISTFEGEAATALMYHAKAYRENMTDADEIELTKGYPYPLLTVDGTLNTKDLVKYMIDERMQDTCVDGLAYLFHHILAEMMAASAAAISKRTGITTAALSGGVFQNTLLLELTETALKKKHLTVLRHYLIPPNDGGLGLGQAVYAMKHLQD